MRYILKETREVLETNLVSKLRELIPSLLPVQKVEILLGDCRMRFEINVAPGEKIPQIEGELRTKVQQVLSELVKDEDISINLQVFPEKIVIDLTVALPVFNVVNLHQNNITLMPDSELPTQAVITPVGEAKKVVKNAATQRTPERPDNIPEDAVYDRVTGNWTWLEVRGSNISVMQTGPISWLQEVYGPNYSPVQRY